MKHFTIDAENNITVHASRKEARETDHGWMLRFLEHRIADQRVLSLIRK